ncbi:cytochrome c oxidase subunit VIIe [Cavenderia fasciculata]|uniref:Cytochrome c oxidase subunit VIIe n=1 Tax=Cavenderia fasciculata TaxID=261658 RepID=F4QFR7_CACFS|nr:cytochrome c oxidase subunit VIIe [Cavenderia fasciculata]EGG14314.1 cytochrome c oxidase subunit VIIe [Cavenderia fasciculata]|eukprot:XP_004351023.1 cytochrome c oxidase subunit VIIe [Cavenderia fasciculata]
MSLVLPGFIKTQILKDIGYGLVIGVIPGLYFKFGYVNKIQREREEYYAALDKQPIDDANI